MKKIKELFAKIEMKKISGKIAIRCAIASLLCLASQKVALAAEEKKGNDYDFLKNGTDNNPFEKLNDALSSTAKSGINFLRTLGYVCVFFALIGIAVGFMVYRNPQMQSQNKRKVIIVVIAGVLIFGAAGIASIIASMGDAVAAS